MKHDLACVGVVVTGGSGSVTVLHGRMTFILEIDRSAPTGASLYWCHVCNLYLTGTLKTDLSCESEQVRRIMES